MSEEEGDPLDGAKGEELEALAKAAYLSPAPLINRFYIALTGPFMRIGFVEQSLSNREQLEPRGAVTMTISDAEELARALMSTISAVSKAYAEAAAKADPTE